MLEVIYVTRHGFRSNWLVDLSTGTYASNIRSPTGIAADPALTAHGVEQARELAAHLVEARPHIERVYSSPYYRCLQTVEPFVSLRRGQGKDQNQSQSQTQIQTQGQGKQVLGEHGGPGQVNGEGPGAGGGGGIVVASDISSSPSSSEKAKAKASRAKPDAPGPADTTTCGATAEGRPLELLGQQSQLLLVPLLLQVRAEAGIGEWYGSAPFQHPAPASPAVLSALFPGLLDQHYAPHLVPTRMGESVGELHDRVAAAMAAVIAECDADGVRAVLLCTHAAVVIALGRVLTGRMPEDIEEEDFNAFTCGLSVFRRRGHRTSITRQQQQQQVAGNLSGSLVSGEQHRELQDDFSAVAGSSHSGSGGTVSGPEKETEKHAGHPGPGVTARATSTTAVTPITPITTTTAITPSGAVSAATGRSNSVDPEKKKEEKEDSKSSASASASASNSRSRPPAWMGGRGVAGGWDCEVNGDCSFLSGGEERGWRFSGDESFTAAAGTTGSADAGIELGVIVEGRGHGARTNNSNSDNKDKKGSGSSGSGKGASNSRL